jgi:hypothetical protein
MDTNKLSELLLVWLVVLAVVAVVRMRRKTPAAGLTMAYLANLSLIHWMGAANCVLPAFHGEGSRFTELGFEQSLYGVAAFAFGGLVLTPLLASKGWLPRPKQVLRADSRLPKAYIAAGVVFYLMSSTSLGQLPTARAIVTGGQQLVLAGLVLCCWEAIKDKDARRLAMWLAAALLMPLMTVVSAGFLGYGAVALMTLLVFVSGFVRSPFKVAVGGLALIYLGLSVFVSYMRDRGEIRAAVWGGESFTQRLDLVAQTATTFEWFDPGNMDHLMTVDSRLNQNYLVGAAFVRLSETDGYARGDTLWDALLALIPRAVWPDKPIEAGSGDLVSRYTGLEFGTGTSVGVGQVMEFYANFGTSGVLIGFVILGVVVTALDLQAAERLARSDLHGFMLWYLPGIALLQVGGQLVELTASAAGSLVVAVLVNQYLGRMQSLAPRPAEGAVIP